MSLRAHLIAAIQRRMIKARLADSPDAAQIRRVLARSGFRTPRGVSVEPGALGGIVGEWIRPLGPEPPHRLLYLHGGGFVACSPRTHRPLTGALARRGFAVFAPRYRRAPENPFPAALDDAVAAWTELFASGPAVLAGDSAGGNLALATMLRARDAGLALPRAAALFSPVTDLALTGGSVTENAARDTMLDPALLRTLAAAYLGGADPGHPLASPLRGDLAGLPPLLVHVGAREVLRDDAIRLAEAARSAGVPVSLTVWPAVPHVWQFADRWVPEARRSLDEAASFLKGP